MWSPWSCGGLSQVLTFVVFMTCHHPAFPLAGILSITPHCPFQPTQPLARSRAPATLDPGVQRGSEYLPCGAGGWQSERPWPVTRNPGLRPQPSDSGEFSGTTWCRGGCGQRGGEPTGSAGNFGFPAWKSGASDPPNPAFQERLSHAPRKVPVRFPCAAVVRVSRKVVRGTFTSPVHLPGRLGSWP